MEHKEISGIFELKYMDWQRDLEEMKFSMFQPARVKVYICSPLGDESRENIYYNMLSARFYMYWLMAKSEKNAVAPHAYLPVLLDDTAEQEREVALSFGQTLLHSCDEVYVCGRTVSAGMEKEIRVVAKRGLPIHTFHADVHDTVQKTCRALCSTSKMSCTIGSPFGLDRVDLRSWGIFQSKLLMANSR